LIFLALSAYLKVLRVSSMLESAGLAHAIINVWLLPPSESKTKSSKTNPSWVHVYNREPFH
jgi:hypothetical protein